MACVSDATVAWSNEHLIDKIWLPRWEKPSQHKKGHIRSQSSLHFHLLAGNVSVVDES